MYVFSDILRPSICLSICSTSLVCLFVQPCLPHCDTFVYIVDYPKLYNSKTDVVVPKHLKLTRFTLLFNFSSFDRVRVF